MSGFSDGLFQTFLNWLYSSGDISVPSDFHSRCGKIQEMLDNDISGVINSLLNYSIQSASEANYRIECNQVTLQKLLNIWLQEINLEVKGIPTGLQALSKEYFKERWAGSSFCVLRATNWEKISLDNVTIEVPKVLWFANGSSIYVKRPQTGNYKLGSDEYYLDESKKIKIPVGSSEYVSIQKPYDRWFDEYASPYLVRNGVLKNWLGMRTLQQKSDEVLSKIIPYLFMMQKGTEGLFLAGADYKDEELKQMVDNFKTEAQKYKNEKGKLPAHGVPFDQKYEHLIPDLRAIMSEELYRQGFRSILAGLGFVDMLEISPSRQERRLNPRPFVSEVNSGVEGFKSMLLDVVLQIVSRNKEAHRKFFSGNNKLLVVSSPLKINVEEILSDIRSGFDRGSISIKSYIESLGFDYETEKERREQESDEGIENTFYPHLIQNQEGIPDHALIPAKPKTDTKQNLEDQNKKSGSPEANTKTAELEEDLEIAPYKTNKDLPEYLQYLPEGAKDVFRKVFNDAYPKGEDYAYPVAYSAMKRWLKAHNYKKNDKGKWVKAEEIE